jgi:hypothetical protein
MKSGRTLKTLLTAIVVFASMITGMAQVPSYVPTSGLVGWWPFNGNANDESGNGNNGTVNGATLTADRNGNANAAYSFDGVNDLIRIGHQNQLNLIGDFSISIWCNIAQIPTSNNNHILVCKRDDNGNCCSPNVPYGFYITYQVTQAPQNYKMPGCQFANSGNYSFSNSNNIISINTWQHLMYTFSNDTLNIYQNSILMHTEYFPSSNRSANTSDLLFGSVNRNVGAEWLNGLLDDIGIWNRALTQQEITNLYTSSTPSPCNPLAANLTNGLVGYWPFCGNANDESGNGNNGTVNGVTLTTDRFGNVDAAYSFDGNGDYIRISHSNELRLSGNFSISAWVSPSNLNTFNSILSKASNDQSFVSGWVWGYSNFTQPAKLHFQGSPLFTNVSISNLGNSLSLNSWKNVIVTYDSTTSILKYYLDNIKIDSFLIGYDFTNSLLDLFIGNHFQNNDPSLQVQTNGSFLGQIDDICIWNRALTQNEITQLYTGSPCVSYQVITVTDTLIINANITGVNPVTFQNSIKVYPNPSSLQITIDFGANFNTLAGYTMRIQNAVGQIVYTTGVTQQQFTSNLSTWTGNGIYFVYLLDAQGNTVDVKKIILQ